VFSIAATSTRGAHMKKLFVGLAIIGVIVIGLVLYAGSQAGVLVTAYKPEIEKAASQALGSQVHLGKIDLKLFPSIRAEVDNVSVKNKGSQAQGLSLSNLLLGIELMPLLSGKLEISSVSLESPALVFIKDARGVYLEGLPPPAPGNKNTKNAPEKKTNDSVENVDPPQEAIQAPLDISVNEIKINNASITFDDKTLSKQYVVDSLDLKVGVGLSGDMVSLNDLSIQGSILGKTDFSVSGAEIKLTQSTKQLEAPKINLQLADAKFTTAASLNLKTFAGTVTLDQSSINIAGLLPLLAEFDPTLQSYKPVGTIAPSAKITLQDAKSFTIDANAILNAIGALVGGLTISDVAGNVQISGNARNQTLSLPDLSLLVNGQPIKAGLKAELSPQGAKLNELNAQAFEGAVKADGGFVFDSKAVNSSFSISDLAIEPALKTVAPQSSMFLLGTLKSFSGKLGGNLAGKRPLAGVTANTSLSVVDGKLLGVNIMGKVLQALTSLPIISGGLGSKLPPEARSNMESDDTLIKQLQATFSLSNEVLKTNDLELVSSAFRLTAQGSVGLDTSIDLRSQFRFNPSVSEALASSVKELRKLVDKNGEMIIPLQLSGKGSSIIVLPDLQEVTKTIAQGVIREKASDLISEGLGKLFGR
ncbi:MAG: AsmA family protein, partial [Bdellovibrionales bacterium]|nr:AsmA family protein [Bdellovibrionales bacterium]